MEEILHHLIGSFSDLQGFIHARWCRFSSINSMDALGFLGWAAHVSTFCYSCWEQNISIDFPTKNKPFLVWFLGTQIVRHTQTLASKLHKETIYTVLRLDFLSKSLEDSQESIPKDNGVTSSSKMSFLHFFPVPTTCGVFSFWRPSNPSQREFLLGTSCEQRSKPFWHSILLMGSQLIQKTFSSFKLNGYVVCIHSFYFRGHATFHCDVLKHRIFDAQHVSYLSSKPH